MKRIWLFDDEAVVARAGAERVVIPPRKHRANPLMQAAAPWEGKGGCFEWPTVLYDREEGLFKCWYEAHCQGRKPSYICYAVSEDGVKWTRPDLGLFTFDRSKKNNICYRGIYGKIRAKCVNVIKRAPDDYHLYIWDALTPTGRCGHMHYVSRDGIRWQRGGKNPVAQTPADRTTSSWEDVLRVSYDEKLREFLLGCRAFAFNNLDEPQVQEKVEFGFYERRVCVATSRDGEHFTDLRLVLKPQLNDPWDVQFYSLAPFRFEDAYLGYLQDYCQGRPKMDAELVYSPDMKRWTRVRPNTPYIPNGPKGAPDCGLIHTTPAPIRKDGRLLIYYWGTNSDHAGGSVDGRRPWGSLNLAIADPDRMVALKPRPDGKGGHVAFKPIRIPRGQLMIDAKTGKGCVLVSLRDGRTMSEIPGFRRDDCLPITGDSHHHVVRWKSGRTLDELRGKNAMIHVRFEDGLLYGMSIGAAPKG